MKMFFLSEVWTTFLHTKKKILYNTKISKYHKFSKITCACLMNESVHIGEVFAWAHCLCVLCDSVDPGSQRKPSHHVLQY